MKSFQKYLIPCLIFLVSCMNMKHGDFAKRKYLDLKHGTEKEITSSEENSNGGLSPVLPVAENKYENQNGFAEDGTMDTSDPVDQKESTVASKDPVEEMLTEALERDYTVYVFNKDKWYRIDSAVIQDSELVGKAVQIKEEEIRRDEPNICLHAEEVYIQDTETNEISILMEDLTEIKSSPFIYPQEDVSSMEESGEEEPKGDDRYFEKLTEEQKAKALDDFNWIFNLGYVLFFLSALFFVLAVFSTWIYLFPAIMLIVTVWILSFTARGKVRKIDYSKQSAYFRFQYTAAWLISILGTCVAIITIVGGLIMLIMWVQGTI